MAKEHKEFLCKLIIKIKMPLFKIIIKFIKNPDLLKSNISYAQEGEDLILNTILEGRKTGFMLILVNIIPCAFLTQKFSMTAAGISLTLT